MNLITLTGRLTRDLETKTLSNNLKVCSGAIAVKGYKDEVDFFNFSIWSEKTIDVAEKYLNKGDMFSIVGSMKTSKKDNITYYTVQVQSLHLLPNPRKEQGNNNQNNNYSKPKTQTRQAQTYQAQSYQTTDEDLPF